MTTGFVHISNDLSTLVRTLTNAIHSKAWNYLQSQGQGDSLKGGKRWSNGNKDPTRGSHVWTCSYKPSPKGPYKNCHVFFKKISCNT